MNDQITESSGNVFADLGLADAEEHRLKADIVLQIDRLMRERSLTQSAAAQLAGLAQPDLSNLLRGRVRGFSVERLMRVLTAFGQQVEIRIRPGGGSTEPIRVVAEDAA